MGEAELSEAGRESEALLPGCGFQPVRLKKKVGTGKKFDSKKSSIGKKVRQFTHTQKFFRYLIKSNRNQIVFTVFLLI